MIPSRQSEAERNAPHVPRYYDVPAGWKHPLGPYRQAPPEYGGEWWYSSPFTGSDPWRTQLAPGALPDISEQLPPGFAETFGARPKITDFPGSYADYAIARSRWEQNLKDFRGLGIPEGYTPEQVDLAIGLFEAWGMGRPVFYEGRYGWFARFPDSAIPEFEINASAAIEFTHTAVSHFQSRLLQDGGLPDTVHPFVPPALQPEEPTAPEEDPEVSSTPTPGIEVPV